MDSSTSAKGTVAFDWINLGRHVYRSQSGLSAVTNEMLSAGEGCSCSGKTLTRGGPADKCSSEDGLLLVRDFDEFHLQYKQISTIFRVRVQDQEPQQLLPLLLEVLPRQVSAIPETYHFQRSRYRMDLETARQLRDALTQALNDCHNQASLKGLSP